MDNLKEVKQNLDIAINPDAGEGQIFAQAHNDVFSEMLQKVGKYTGFPYIISGGPAPAAIANGDMFVVNKLNEPENGVALLAGQTTQDGDDWGNVLKECEPFDIFHLKDNEGRSSYFHFESYSVEAEVGGGQHHAVKLVPLPGNPNYEYLTGQKVICIVDIMKRKTRPFQRPNKFIGGDDPYVLVEGDDMQALYVGSFGQQIQFTSGIFENGTTIVINNSPSNKSMRLVAAGNTKFCTGNANYTDTAKIPPGYTAELFLMKNQIGIIEDFWLVRYLTTEPVEVFVPTVEPLAQMEPGKMFYYYANKETAAAATRLPEVANSVGVLLIITNRGTADFTVQSAFGDPDICDNGSSISSLIVPVDGVLKLLNIDGQFIVI